MRPAAYTVPEVAAMLRIARSTVYRLIRAGKIPSVRGGEQIRVPCVAMDRLLDPGRA
jgi:excisionase family DNA binding protein